MCDSFVQAQVLSSDAVEGLTRLAWEGPDHPITPAALHAIANLAAGNKQAQDALREAGQRSLNPVPTAFASSALHSHGLGYLYAGFRSHATMLLCLQPAVCCMDPCLGV